MRHASIFVASVFLCALAPAADSPDSAPRAGSDGSALSIEPGHAASGPTILRECPDGSLVSQPLDDTFFTANTSDLEFDFVVSDSLDPAQLPVGGSVGLVRYWGLSIQFDDEGGVFVATCLDDNATPFDVAFLEDNGVPNDFMYGAQVAARTLTPTIFDTAIPFAFTTILEYDATISPEVSEAFEWVQATRQTGQSDPCLFLWVNNLGTYGGEARQDGASTPEIAWDFTVCVAPAAGSDCCFPNGTPGCDDPGCEAIVCDIDPFCCDVEWDQICADEAADLCGDLCVSACFTTLDEQVTCHPDGETFTVDVEGVNECTGAVIDFSHTASGGAPGEQFCFTVTINDAGGGLCCTQTICTTIPDCTEPALPCDVDGDDVINGTDLLLLLGAWGTDPGGPPDFDLDGNVGASDLLTLVASWGPCG